MRLTLESFSWIQRLLASLSTSPDDLHCLVMSVIINDLGKDAKLAVEYQELTGENIESFNHDVILIKAVNAGLIRCLDRLPSQQMEYLIRGLKLEAELNLGQLAQAENPPAALSVLRCLQGDKRAFDEQFTKLLLDVSGAMGHMDWTSAKLMTEPVLQTLCAAYDAGSSIVSGECGVWDAYNIVLTRRAHILSEKGLRSLDINDFENRALMRLLCMGRVTDVEVARSFESTWQSLSPDVRQSLAHNLNLVGSVTEPAVLPTYMPALLSEIVDLTVTETEDVRKRALDAAFRYLSRVMTITRKPSKPVDFVERSVLRVVKEVVQCQEFRANPEILETTDIPEDVVG
jgi:hypothetical protein